MGGAGNMIFEHREQIILNKIKNVTQGGQLRRKEV